MSDRRSPRFAEIVLLALATLLPGGAATPGPVRPSAPSQAQNLPPAAQKSPGDEQAWKEFIAWFKTAPAGADPFALYGEELANRGLTPDEIQRRFSVILRLFATHPEGAEVFYDKTYSRPVTGKPWEDGFASAPSEFLIGAVKGLKPGCALDVGMGQGRNAVELARQGWTVTGVDASGEAIVAAGRNAEAAGVRITGIKDDYATFDFGRDAWDLVVMIFAWAPVDEPAFVERVRASLKPGGLVVFENFVSTPDRPRPPMVRALPPGGARAAFAGFEILSYEEVTGTGDWGGPDSRLVRMIVRRL